MDFSCLICEILLTSRKGRQKTCCSYPSLCVSARAFHAALSQVSYNKSIYVRNKQRLFWGPSAVLFLTTFGISMHLRQIDFFKHLYIQGCYGGRDAVLTDSDDSCHLLSRHHTANLKITHFPFNKLKGNAAVPILKH